MEAPVSRAGLQGTPWYLGIWGSLDPWGPQTPRGPPRLDANTDPPAAEAKGLRSGRGSLSFGDKTGMRPQSSELEPPASVASAVPGWALAGAVGEAAGRGPSPACRCGWGAIPNPLHLAEASVRVLGAGLQTFSSLPSPRSLPDRT